MPRVTIAEVARMAGVSPTAVSFTFNRPSELSSDTVRKVLAVAEELGYAPNPHAKALHSSRAGVLGILAPEAISDAFANPFYAPFVRGVGSVCDEMNLSLMVVSPHEGSLEKGITKAPVDGFIVLGASENHPDVSPLYRRRVPFVIVDGEANNAPSVNIEDEGGAYDAAARLLARGHTDVLVVSFLNPRSHLEDPYHDIASRRQKGYMRAFAEHGVEWGENPSEAGQCSIEGGERAFEEAWSVGRRPTAILCAADALAFGVLLAAEKRGIHIPEDLEVVGFDDVPEARLSRPALSTVRQPIREKGRLAAELLTAALDGGEHPRQNITLPTEWVPRTTTR
ncbi:MAG: LacI family DNA-binding transcriptional regulator [Rubrobacter sp.]|nr:LacI family DNA-binding transcriptional regulator [Rubrobacter sp.]